MEENISKNSDIIQSLHKEYGVLKHSSGNYRCHRCFMVDGYSEEEKRCRWCNQILLEIDKI